MLHLQDCAHMKKNLEFIARFSAVMQTWLNIKSCTGSPTGCLVSSTAFSRWLMLIQTQSKPDFWIKTTFFQFLMLSLTRGAELRSPRPRGSRYNRTIFPWLPKRTRDISFNSLATTITAKGCCEMKRIVQQHFPSVAVDGNPSSPTADD